MARPEQARRPARGVAARAAPAEQAATAERRLPEEGTVPVDPRAARPARPRGGEPAVVRVEEAPELGDRALPRQVAPAALAAPWDAAAAARVEHRPRQRNRRLPRTVAPVRQPESQSRAAAVACSCWVWPRPCSCVAARVRRVDIGPASRLGCVLRRRGNGPARAPSRSAVVLRRSPWRPREVTARSRRPSPP